MGIRTARRCCSLARPARGKKYGKRYKRHFRDPDIHEFDTDAASKKFESIIDGMKCYTAQELEAALRAAGFAEVVSDRHPSKP